MANTSHNDNSDSRATQRKLLVLILLGILGVCVGLGWWMTKRIDTPTAQGIEIVKDIRSRKLLSFWGESKTYRQHFFIYQRVDEKLHRIGWKFEYRSQNRNPQEGFVGGEIEQSFGNEARSHWTLTNGLDKGTYQSHIEQREQNKLVGMGASIEFDNETLRVQQKFPGKNLNSESKIPDNYIPEGAMSLIFREVAKRKTHAKFKMIFDKLPPVGSRPRFGVLDIRYLDSPKENPNETLLLEVKQVVLSNKSTYRLVLDSLGNVVREKSGNIVTRPVSENDFFKVYPYYAKYLRGVSRSGSERPKLEAALPTTGTNTGTSSE